MKEIPLTQGKVALVDDIDFEWLSKWKWTAAKRKTKCGDIYYAVRTDWNHGDQILYLMHREILRCTGKIRGDHIDGNGLNNQRYNLRVATPAQNCQNKRWTKHSSQFKGVSYNIRRGYWHCGITMGDKMKNLGHFTHEVDAAIAYNNAAILYFGEFAKLNPIPNGWVHTPKRIRNQDRMTKSKKLQLTKP